MLVFVKLLIKFSLLKYIMCNMFVQHFELLGRRFTNFHYYYYVTVRCLLEFCRMFHLQVCLAFFLSLFWAVYLYIIILDTESETEQSLNKLFLYCMYRILCLMLMILSLVLCELYSCRQCGAWQGHRRLILEGITSFFVSKDTLARSQASVMDRWDSCSSFLSFPVIFVI